MICYYPNVLVSTSPNLRRGLRKVWSMLCYTYFEYGQVVMIPLLIPPYVGQVSHFVLWSIDNTEKQRRTKRVIGQFPT